jgi:hypothetical protein
VSVLAHVGFSTPRTALGWVLFVGILILGCWRIARARRRARNYSKGHTGTPPAGWYPDSNDPTSLRYFDGQNWTPNIRPRE